MDKRALKNYLKKMLFAELSNDSFLCESRKNDTFTVYKNSILISAGYKLYFAFNFNEKRSLCEHSAVCIDGYELGTRDNEDLFNQLQLFCDCKKSEEDFLNELKAII